MFSDVFIASAASIDVSFVKSSPLGGDSTVLIDNVAVVPVAPGTKPLVLRDPASAVVNIGDSATFDAQVFGSLPFSFQWRTNGVAIAGATNLSLSLNNI